MPNHEVVKSEFDAITFDVYGTLIDWEPALLRQMRNLMDRMDKSPTDSDLIAAFDQARAHYQTVAPSRPYPRILEQLLIYVAAEWGGFPTEAEQREFGQSVPFWPTYQDSLSALQRLKSHFVLGALTNMDNMSFAASRKHLNDPFDVIVTAERARSYKPGLRHFVLAIADLAARNIPPHRILHVAQSRRADIRPCNLLGIKTVHIDRKGRTLGHTGLGAELAKHDAQFETMKDFVDSFLGSLEG